MPIHSIDHAGGTFRHRCAHCGYEADLMIDPRWGHVTVHRPHGAHLDAPAEALVTRPCPHCAAHGIGHDRAPLHVVECFRLNIPAWEAAEEGAPGESVATHPGSLLGTPWPGPPGSGITNVVSEHTVGYHLGAEHVAQARFIRALQRHPHLAAHAPLLPDPPSLPGHPTQRWDGQWRPNVPDVPDVPDVLERPDVPDADRQP